MYTIHTPKDAIHVDTLAHVFHVFFHDASLSAYETAEIFLTRGNTALPVLRYNGILTVRQPGTAHAIFTALFAELRDRWFTKDGKQLLPWQVTRKRWEIFQFVFELATKPAWLLSAEQLENETDAARAAGRRFHLADVCDEVAVGVFGYTSQGPQLSLSGGVNGRHEVHVAYALFQDRPIPESVLADYRGNAKHFKYDLQWFPVLLDIPVLRNPLPYNAMQSAVAIFRHENQPIDAELGERIVEALRTAPADSTYVDVDDRLFAAGLVAKPDLPERYQQSVDVGTARSPVAERLRELIGDAVLKKSLDRLDAERRQGRISQRRYSLQVEMAKLDRGRTTFERPNQFAAVVEARDVAALLKVLDQPAGSNDQSKQVLREQFGLSLRGLNSAGRQRVIFAFCGYDEAAQAEWEAKQDAARVQRLAEEAANDAKEQAGRARYRRRDNVVISGVEHVDQAIAEGYSEIRTFRRGAATRYVLAKPGSTEGRTLHAKNGTLEYARSRLTSPAA
ncbi:MULTISPECIES: hypothetical protein [Burkholderia cepacia complex]|uniref:Uncharacterized protein n=3 Tax=Burkholderia cepacia complex TaxID=87882 RepID=A0A0H3KR46_BURM1|nr:MULTISPECIES: hypothetical protein [Burkholderia cepacia complex]ABX19270.1 conserved hypothetical protein [Burkholderia multivorans ATCC 17616]AIO71844.1 hypothetical protein DM80_5820 [Burkholderia multivorans]AOK69204.1 hypothetical protein WM33_26425 [Burkholderia multivorans]KVV34462.1 hypothetical protein WK80_03145 [Burkholderia multivorans]KVZ76052.1 hypothetical protein WL23_21865 [Burkholderia multivorans]